MNRQISNTRAVQQEHTFPSVTTVYNGNNRQKRR
jgi:hypothetical protein